MAAREMDRVLETVTSAEVIVTYASVEDWRQGLGKAAELQCHDLLNRLIASVPVPLDLVDSLVDERFEWDEVEKDRADGWIPYSSASVDVDMVIAYLSRHG